MLITAGTNVPPTLVMAIIEVESDFIPTAVHYNTNGTIDRGLMQLNSAWYNDANWDNPSANIYQGVKHLEKLRSQTDCWYKAVIAYNCGIGRINDPPNQSLDYAVKVYAAWTRYAPGVVAYFAGR
jgi:soluble lytic murein transglycosylase-like protein